MNDLGSAYRAFLPFCKKLIRMGARAITLHRTAGIPLDMARRMCRDMGKESPPGQTPDDASFFTQNLALRRQGALLLILYHAYRSCCDRYPYSHPFSSAGHLIGITFAYREYQACFSLSEMPPVSIERFEMLARGYDYIKEHDSPAGIKGTGQKIAAWREIPTGGRGLHPRDSSRQGTEKLSSTKVLPCRTCRVLHLVEGYRLGQWSCPACVMADKARKKAKKEAAIAERREQKARLAASRTR